MLDEILGTLLDGRVTKVQIGLHWTAVVVETEGQQRCGLASTLSTPHYHHGQVDVPQAGQLASLPGPELAKLAKGGEQVQAGVGMAAINALLPHQAGPWIDLNASNFLAEQGAS